jgi:Ca2+-binding EF-hand superfamily protein
VRVEVRSGAGDAEAAWRAFLERLFAFHDRDGDGKLTPAEAARVFPLPLPGRREAKLDFAAADTDGDGKLTPAEFKEFFRRAGFTPIVVHVVPATADDLRLAETLFRALDRDGNGKLTPAELARATALLDRFDLNEDELLTPAELLFGSSVPPSSETEQVTVSRPDAQPAAALVQIDLDRDRKQVSLAAQRDKTLVELTGGGENEVRFRLAGSVCTVRTSNSDKARRFQAAQQFYLASFKTACEGKAFLEKKQLAQDAGLQVLAGLFDPADRDGDGKLTQSELESFLALIEMGVRCQTVVTVTDRGRNLFEVLDVDRDGRLDLRELNQAAKHLAAFTGMRDTWALTDIPRQYQFVVERGTAGNSFGPVTLAGGARRTEEARPRSTRGPRWFRAQDRNGDGYLSPNEFLGPPELFRRLDLDGDGLISAEEAEKAERAPR